MSYNWLTQYNSPNYTPANRVQATWGRPRTIEAIAIHWWDDPAKNPSFEGVIATLTNPNRGASAHIVATGTGRRAACLVNLTDASWATNSANPYTISIECDPRCRDEDYDVIGEVIAQLRSIYGNLPLVPHKQFASTACPGNYDLARLDREARNKIAKPEWDWGHVENKAPVITTKDETKTENIPFETVRRPDADQLVGWEQQVQSGSKGSRTIVTRITYTDGAETGRQVVSDVIVAPVDEVIYYGTMEAPVVTPDPEPEIPTPTEPEVPTENNPKPSEPTNTQLEAFKAFILDQLTKLLAKKDEIIAWVKSLFNKSERTK